MRFYRLKEEDGSAEAALCSLCGATIYDGEEYYHINAQAFCTDCLEDYARRVFAPFVHRGGENTWQ